MNWTKAICSLRYKRSRSQTANAFFCKLRSPNFDQNLVKSVEDTQLGYEKKADIIQNLEVQENVGESTPQNALENGEGDCQSVGTSRVLETNERESTVAENIGPMEPKLEAKEPDTIYGIMTTYKFLKCNRLLPRLKNGSISSINLELNLLYQTHQAAGAGGGKFDINVGEHVKNVFADERLGVAFIHLNWKPSGSQVEFLTLDPLSPSEIRAIHIFRYIEHVLYHYQGHARLDNRNARHVEIVGDDDSFSKADFKESMGLPIIDRHSQSVIAIVGKQHLQSVQCIQNIVSQNLLVMKKQPKSIVNEIELAKLSEKFNSTKEPDGMLKEQITCRLTAQGFNVDDLISDENNKIIGDVFLESQLQCVVEKWLNDVKNGIELTVCFIFTCRPFFFLTFILFYSTSLMEF